jgi:hypothetical protein
MRGAVPACFVFLLLLFAAPASAAPGWLNPADLSKPGRDASNPVVGMDSAGNTIAMWERQSPSDPSINLQISTRVPGAGFTEGADFMKKPSEPRLVMTPGGMALAVWKRLDTGLGVYVIEGATRPPGGPFSAPFNVYTAPPQVIPQEVEASLAENGAIAVSWSRIDPTANYPHLICGIDPMTHLPIHCPDPSFVEATVRPAGGTFAKPERVSPEGFEKPEETEEEKEEREIEESVRSAGEGRIAVDTAARAVVVWAWFDGTDEVTQWTAREGTEHFNHPATQLSESGENAAEPEIKMDAAGNAVAVWARNDGADREIQAATRPPGGAFTQLGDISPPSGVAVSPSLAVNSGGTATAVWRLTGFSEDFIEAATRPPGGPFASQVDISSGKDNPLFPEVAMNDAGAAVVVWTGANSVDQIVRAAVRPAGGSFGAPVAISQSSPDLFHPHVAIDLGGDASVVWVRSNGFNDIVQTAGYDGSPPTISGVSIPGAGKVGQPLSFTASDADTWPIGPPHFAFGDGSEADGTSVSHAYSKPGSYQTVITATDAGGTTTTATGLTLVKARNDITVGKLSRNRRVGTATLELTVPEPGTAVVTGKGIKKATVRFEKGGTLKASLRPDAKGRKGLNKKGRLKAKLRISYSPVGGDANTISHSIALRKILG